ncbi:hypothetical protein CSQ85_08810 [Bifidobacterium rousetti]|uniref:hypothetical protein n=1 Tax=Bifidobacterium rousetti TaxID=2045439 RepID=UPI00123BAD4F|nr:hypothetical protein [Bifidobacterium rousetti]KAA8818251.1 hypothetical protein CSQ85_08810 [Bifidobacterium rousetti]
MNTTTIPSTQTRDRISNRYIDLQGRLRNARAIQGDNPGSTWDAFDGEGRRIGWITSMPTTGKVYSYGTNPQTGACVDDTVEQALRTLINPHASLIFG